MVCVRKQTRAAPVHKETIMAAKKSSDSIGKKPNILLFAVDSLLATHMSFTDTTG